MRPLAYTLDTAMIDAIPRLGATVLLLTLGCAAHPAPAPVAPPIAAPVPDDPLGSLAWLAGTWESDDPTGPRTVEHWLAPDGGTMLGVNRTAKDGRTVFFEYLRIEAGAHGPAYLASPAGRAPPIPFAAAASGPSWIAFENSEHDFPQRIEYRREGDRLQMRVSGLQDGAPRASEWSMRRIGD
jgi:hypothetical protein